MPIIRVRLSATCRALGALLIAMAAISWPCAQAQEIIVTIAGGGMPADPRLAGIRPIAVSTAPDGSLYIGIDTQVLRLGVDGQLEVAAGSGIYGSAVVATGTAALSANLTIASLVCDARGDLYIGTYGPIYKLDHQTGTLALVAGDNSNFDLDEGGPALTAYVGSATGLAINAAGDLFYSDYGTERVRRIAAATGIVTTVAGIGIAGNFPRSSTGDGGPATAATLNEPYGLAFDTSGNLYIADRAAACVRRIAADSGTITTVAGGGGIGDGVLVGQPATLSRLNAPYSVCFDAAGNLYFCDRDDNSVYAVAVGTGILSRFAGTGFAGSGGDGGPAVAATLTTPEALAFGRDGRLIIADSFEGRVRAVAPITGTISTLAGNGHTEMSGDGGPATQAQFGQFVGVALAVAPDGDLYIADQTNNRVRRLSMATGIISTVAGSGTAGFGGDGGPAIVARLDYPAGLAFNHAGDLLISDMSNSRLRKVAAGTGIISTIVGTGALSGFGGLRGDGGPATAASLGYPEGLFVALNDDLYIADALDNRVRLVSAASGSITTVAGGGTPANHIGDGLPATSAEVDNPIAVVRDQSGNLLVGDQDSSGGHIRRVSATDGTISTIAARSVLGAGPGVGDGGLATAARLSNVASLLFDVAGDLLVSDRNNHRIRSIAHASGIITTIAGTGVEGFSGDGGTPTSAMLSGPCGTVLAADGSLFIADQGNRRIRMVTSAVAPFTWVAQPLAYGTVLGAGQLSATTATAGDFTYSPPAGTRLGVGAHLLHATFSPTPTLHLPPVLVSAIVTIAPAPLLVVADDQRCASGAPVPTLTYHLSGLVAGDSASVVTGTPTFTTTAASGSPDGTYPIDLDTSRMTAINYVIAGTPGTLSIGTAHVPAPSAGAGGGGHGGCGLGALAAVGATLVFLLAVRNVNGGRRVG